MAGLYTTGFKESDGIDVGDKYLEKSVLIDRYPFLVDTWKSAGLWLWGSNHSGQLGDNSLTHRSSPVQTVSGGTNWRYVSISAAGTGAIKTDGTLWMWGQGDWGMLGNNTITTVYSPVQTISGGTNWKQVEYGGASVTAIKNDGSLWSWGDGVYGAIGNNSIIYRSSPVQTVSAGTNWKQVSAGVYHVTAIKNDGSLWLWGNGTAGQLGNNSIIDRSSPVQTVSTGTDWKQVSAGGYSTMAIKTDGTLWGWGDNRCGQLGTNNRTNISSPVQTVSGGNDWKQASAGLWLSAAIKTDGTLWVWGDNLSGELGDNTLINKSSPVQTVSGGTNWKYVDVGLGGPAHSAAIKTDGTLWVWGNGACGKLGANTLTSVSSPIQTISGGTNWKSVSAGPTSIAAIREAEDF